MEQAKVGPLYDCMSEPTDPQTVPYIIAIKHLTFSHRAGVAKLQKEIGRNLKATRQEILQM